MRSMECSRPGRDGGRSGRRGFSGARYVLVLNVKPLSQGTPSSIHALIRVISFAERGFPFDGIRSSESVEVIRLTNSLAALFPGTTTLAFSKDCRVSSDSEPLYLPLVWHSAQRALMMGAMS